MVTWVPGGPEVGKKEVMVGGGYPNAATGFIPLDPSRHIAKNTGRITFIKIFTKSLLVIPTGYFSNSAENRSQQMIL